MVEPTKGCLADQRRLANLDEVGLPTPLVDQGGAGLTWLTLANQPSGGSTKGVAFSIDSLQILGPNSETAHIDPPRETAGPSPGHRRYLRGSRNRHVTCTLWGTPPHVHSPSLATESQGVDAPESVTVAGSTELREQWRHGLLAVVALRERPRSVSCNRFRTGRLCSDTPCELTGVGGPRSRTLQSTRGLHERTALTELHPELWVPGDDVARNWQEVGNPLNRCCRHALHGGLCCRGSLGGRLATFIHTLRRLYVAGRARPSVGPGTRRGTPEHRTRDTAT